MFFSWQENYYNPWATTYFLRDRMEETIGLGFHSHRDAITGVASSTAAVAAVVSTSSSNNKQYYATTKFVSSSDSKMMFPPPPPAIASSTHDIHQNSSYQRPPAFQPPPELPPPLSITTAAMTIPLQQPMQSHQIEQQQKKDAIAKARAIAQRFHTESTQQPPSYTSINNEFHNTTSSASINSHNINISDNAQKRQQHFEAEKLKLQTFTLKNLEYIMNHENAELRSHVDCMNEMTAWGERQGLQLQLMRQQQKEQQENERKQRQLEKRSGGGVGSNDQRCTERIRKRRQFEQHPNGGISADNTTSANQQQQQTPIRTSIYLTNLPKDGSITERTLRSLFCVYGRLDRVTMYRNRSTGELKGDGLIVFGRDAVAGGGNESNDAQQVTTENNGGDGLVEAVCMQMNGAELPCGTVIGVEPADLDWGNDDKKEKKSKIDRVQQQLQQAATTSNDGESKDVGKQSKEASASIDAATEEMKEQEDDDLEDFFASLE